MFKPIPVFMFIAALFVIVQNWKQPKCPSTVEWLNKPVHPYRGLFLSNEKEQTVDHPTVWMNYAEWKKIVP